MATDAKLVIVPIRDGVVVLQRPHSLAKALEGATAGAYGDPEPYPEGRTSDVGLIASGWLIAVAAISAAVRKERACVRNASSEAVPSSTTSMWRVLVVRQEEVGHDASLGRCPAC